jgi:acyl carrier protein
MSTEIRDLIAQHARLAVDVGTLSDDSSLYEAGMTSHATVNLMLALTACSPAVSSKASPRSRQR